MEDVSDRTSWTIERHGADVRRGRWEATVVAVDPGGEVAVLAHVEGTSTSASAALSLQVVAEMPPPDVAGDLAREAVRVATEFGATRIVVALDPCDRVAHDAIEASALDWRLLATGGSAYAEVTVSPPGD